MSKFHFDETVMDVTASELGTVKDSIDNGISIILSTGLTIGLQKGFSVEDIFSDLSAEKDKLKYCGERLEEGRNAVKEICANVRSYEKQSEFRKGLGATDGFGKEFDKFGISCYNSRWQSGQVWSASLLNAFDYFERGFSGIVSGKGAQGGIEYENAKNAFETILANLNPGSFKYNDDEAKGVFEDVFKSLKNGKSVDEVMGSGIYDKEIKGYLSDLGEIIDVSKLSVEIAEQWFTDYSQAVIYIDSLRNHIGNMNIDIANDVIDELKAEYSSKYWQTVKTVIDKAVEKAGGKIVGDLTSMIGSEVTAVYNIEKYACDLVSKVTQLDKVSDAFDTLNGLVSMESGTKTAYNLAAQKIASGTYTDADLADYRRLFELNKSLKISEFEALIKLDNDAAFQKEYNSKIAELTAMTCPL